MCHIVPCANQQQQYRASTLIGILLCEGEVWIYFLAQGPLQQQHLLLKELSRIAHNSPFLEIPGRSHNFRPNVAKCSLPFCTPRSHITDCHSQAAEDTLFKRTQTATELKTRRGGSKWLCKNQNKDICWTAVRVRPQWGLTRGPLCSHFACAAGSLVKQRPLQTKHGCFTGCPRLSGKSWLSQWVNSFVQFATKVTWRTVKASYLLSLQWQSSRDRTLTLLLHGLYIPRAWEWVLRDLGREGEGGRVQTKHLNVIPLMVQLWEGNYLRLFCYDLSEAARFYCPLLNMLQKQHRNCVSAASLSSSLLSCLQSGPLFYVHTPHQPMPHFPPPLWPHLPSQTLRTRSMNKKRTKKVRMSPICFVRKLHDSPSTRKTSWALRPGIGQPATWFIPLRACTLLYVAPDRGTA